MIAAAVSAASMGGKMTPSIHSKTAELIERTRHLAATIVLTLFFHGFIDFAYKTQIWFGLECDSPSLDQCQYFLLDISIRIHLK